MRYFLLLWLIFISCKQNNLSNVKVNNPSNYINIVDPAVVHIQPIYRIDKNSSTYKEEYTEQKEKNCTAVAVDRYLLLTSAHCLEKNYKVQMSNIEVDYILLGVNLLDIPVKAKRLFIHKDYQTGFSKNQIDEFAYQDLAAIMVDRPMSHVYPIWAGKIDKEVAVLFRGYGLTNIPSQYNWLNEGSGEIASFKDGLMMFTNTSEDVYLQKGDSGSPTLQMVTLDKMYVIAIHQGSKPPSFLDFRKSNILMSVTLNSLFSRQFLCSLAKEHLLLSVAMAEYQGQCVHCECSSVNYQGFAKEIIF